MDNYRKTNVYNTGAGYQGMNWRERQKMIDDQVTVNRGIKNKIEAEELAARKAHADRLINGCIVSINPQFAGKYLSKYKLVFNQITANGYRDVWVIKDSNRLPGTATGNNVLLSLIDDPKILIAAAPEDLVWIKDPEYKYDSVSLWKHLAAGAGIGGLIGHFMGGSHAGDNSEVVISALAGAATGGLVAAVRNSMRDSDARDEVHERLKLSPEMRRHLYGQIKLFSAKDLVNKYGPQALVGTVSGGLNALISYKNACRLIDNCQNDEDLKKVWTSILAGGVASATTGAGTALSKNALHVLGANVGGKIAAVGMAKAMHGKIKMPKGFESLESLEEKKNLLKKAAKKVCMAGGLAVGAGQGKFIGNLFMNNE